MVGKKLTTFCALSSDIFNWEVQSNGSRESVNNSKDELNVFASFMFWGRISSFSFKANFEFPKQRFCCYLTKKWLHALPAILKFLGTHTLNICGGVSFEYSYEWVEWTAQIAYTERYYRCFSGNFPKLTKQQFFQISRKKLIK